MIDNSDAIVRKKNGDSSFPFTRATNGILMIWPRANGHDLRFDRSVFFCGFPELDFFSRYLI